MEKVVTNCSLHELDAICFQRTYLYLFVTLTKKMKSVQLRDTEPSVRKIGKIFLGLIFADYQSLDFSLSITLVRSEKY